MPSNLGLSSLFELRGLVLSGEFLCPYYRYSIPLHGDNGETAPVELDGLAGLRDVAQFEKNIPGDGFEAGVGGQLDSIDGGEIEDAGGAVEIHAIGFDV